MLPLHIKVKAGASRDEITRDAEGKLTVKIKERPVEGAANVYLIKFLAKEWGLSKSDIVLEKGLSSPFKKILLNTDQSTLDRVLERYKKS